MVTKKHCSLKENHTFIIHQSFSNSALNHNLYFIVSEECYFSYSGAVKLLFRIARLVYNK